ncbi:MAG: NADH-quinone oxidoreductase subunit J [Betaproteobacteria bacterium]|nr:NADH-quinone oxidoreductase subunit J [Betaproteobacteria bacterium]
MPFVADLATPGGALLVLAIAVPAIGVLAAFALGSRHAARIAIAVVAAGFALAVAVAARVLADGAPLVYVLGNWRPPLGVALRADGLAAVMMLVTTVVLFFVALFARADFATPAGVRDARAPLVFWTMLLAILAALNVCFLAGDLFTLYVALELLTFAAVPLVALDGSAETLRAALRYLLFALAGSLLYLAGTALLYGAYGTLDIALLAGRARADAATTVAAALMTAGLLAKTALFPLHLWLPPAHAGAPAAASAVLSGLVVKGSYFIVLRLWLDALPAVITPAAAQFIGALGAAAIVFGSAVAIAQPRLKLMVAYSTVAQIGYLFLLFPLAVGLAHPEATAITGGMLQVASHATAKAAMFMAAGLVYAALGHDRVADLTGVARTLPITVAAFALSGIALIGLPPAGGFVAKWLLLSAALATAQWWWAVVIVVGGLLTACYVFGVLGRTLATVDPPPPRGAVTRGREAVVLGLAIVATVLGFAAFAPVDLVQVGRPPVAGVPR